MDDDDHIIFGLVTFARWCRVLLNWPHEWSEHPTSTTTGFVWCRSCGMVQRADGVSKPCKGNPGISVRSPNDYIQ